MRLLKKKPVIWVSGPDKGGTAAWLATKFAVRRSGGKAVRVTPSKLDAIRRKSLPDEPHALILGGGADIDPGRYEDLISDLKNIRTSPDEKEPKGQRWVTLILAPLFGLLRKAFSAGSLAVDEGRDNMEWQLLDLAVERHLPVLGICRGAQLINVYHDGTLYQDLASYYKERPKITTIYPRKRIHLETGSRLHDIFGTDSIRVNSLHNQAVKKTGQGIRVVARETDGVAQGIEHQRDSFLIGVQWHPEYLPQVPSQRRLFDELVRYAILRRDAVPAATTSKSRLKNNMRQAEHGRKR
ncbi:gamma-glutamyl-gamma-aminobutyrate hydrolase family protein [Natronogracilivirga saccharolytica]|uniref:Gamma-glutamyl-gamma-aminobutyrate hydrolase family protein n=1 Tax=Natronogracilivirga saccharolytica TaxID=2812953 RepID=A0A8J7UUP6_9BACT|nr:gamma-glutamyl-gamma-aminobutyrate hydrolase family protein [Natronogracilivirga saccharolytica]MBP3191732.1 gamma-glutamyl-gamma-aminobutyrate hydrolase family protein [Natronogracilivirga saccharolytica]